MRLSYLWLNDWVEHGLSPELLAAGLTSAGLETNIVRDLRGAYDNVVVGRVVSVSPHPGADNIRVTEVDINGATLQIVCGAPNVERDQRVAVALIGAKLPNGMVIEKRKLRGVESSGMICSEAELGISAESNGIMVLQHGAPLGGKLAGLYELEDVILEVDITPNRGDCLSVWGIAREAAAISGGKLKLPDTMGEWGTGLEGFSVYVENNDGCPRYTAREIRGVTVGPSPLKVRRRLFAAGVRPVNNVVDATNYIMLETGHPLHAFDRRDLQGDRIIVRNAHAGERFTTLDGKVHELPASALLIADANRGVALAGVMGGLNSEVKPDTTEIILEAAYFDPVCVRKTAKALGVSTESSYRFERGVDPRGVAAASLLAARMIGASAGGKTGGFADVYPTQAQPPAIRLRTAKVNDTLGLALGDQRILDHLGSLGFDCKMEGEGLFAITAPSWRHDVKIEMDLIEEVARLHGYANIPATAPRLAQHETADGGTYRARSRMADLLAAAGFYETLSYSFINPAWRTALGLSGKEPVPMENRINADLCELRTALLPGLLGAAVLNLRRGEETLSLFETGAVFSRAANEVHEEFHCAALMTVGKEEILGTGIPRDFLRLKGILQKVVKALAGAEPAFVRPAGAGRRPYLYTHRQAEIRLGGTVIGVMGQMHPLALQRFDIEAPMVCFELSADALIQSGGKGYAPVEPLPRFPGIKRDMALIVDERTEAGGIVETILDTDRALIRHCRLFDLYQGPQVPAGKKSLAFRLFIQNPEQTLTDKAGDDLMAAILKRVGEKHGAELRA
ncbi:MAG: phenylalanine--tRNA ligase subunit beta [Nitrospinae bacterium]|nr:phenylalanine--tRNA ligase subunit beta [Nitrospinota bacterium]